MPKALDLLKEAAFERGGDIEHLLRLSRAAALELAQPEIAEWSRFELYGYDGNVAVPPYRRASVRLILRHTGWGSSMWVDPSEDIPVRWRVTTIERYCKPQAPDDFTVGDPDDVFLNSTARAEDVVVHATKFDPKKYSVAVRYRKSELRGILDRVRDAVGDWAFAFKNAGDDTPGRDFQPTIWIGHVYGGFGMTNEKHEARISNSPGAMMAQDSTTGSIAVTTTQSVRPSTESIQPLLDSLTKEIESLRKSMSEEVAARMDKNLDALKREVSSKAPEQRWYDVSLSGLKDAALAMGEMATPITAAVKRLADLLSSGSTS